MAITTNELASELGRAASGELQAAHQKIEHCLAQLDDTQVWWRPAEDMNSIANLLLHLAGNLRQWIVAGVGGADDTRDRSAEFADRSQLAKAEVAARLNEAVNEAAQILGSVTAEQLVARRRVQGFDISGAQAIFDSVAHFRGHSQEIVHLTRQILGADYQFDFVPQTPEQGAPG